MAPPSVAGAMVGGYASGRVPADVLPDAAPDLDVLLVGAAASIPGALIGSRLTGRLSQEQLIRAIAWVLLVAAAGIVAQIVA